MTGVGSEPARPPRPVTRTADGGAEPTAGPASPSEWLRIDRLFLGYMAATGLLALVAGGRVGALLFAAHLAVGAGVLLLSRRPFPSRALFRFVRLAYPVALTPLLYAELAILNQFVTVGYLDTLVQAWEEAVFGLQPSIEASGWLASLWFSEFLHLGYFCYYVLVPAALLGAWATRGDAALHRTAFATAAAFFLSYAIFIFFPVAGPRYSFPRIEGALTEGSLFGLVHAVLESASSKGTAFPSSHVAAAGAAVVAAGLEDRRWLWALIVPWTALTLGTVYGRFHYGIDALAGIVIAAVAVGWTYRSAWADASPGRPYRSATSSSATAPDAATGARQGSDNSRSRMEEGSTGSPPT